MKVVFSIVGSIDPFPNVTTHLDCVPQVGQTVTLPGLDDSLSSVRTVVWYPLGDPEESSQESFVYVVLGPARR